MSRRILLTGASGYAGGVVARELRRQGATVITAGRRASDDLKLDLLDPAAIASLSLPTGIDACVHAAALHELDCAKAPELAYVGNVAATRALVQAAAAAGIARIVYISTFHVYGKPSGRLDESVPAAPANDYGLTHWQAEQVLRTACARFGMAMDLLRPANLFGCPASWQDFDRWTLAPFDFCRQAVDAGRIVLHGQGAAVRNYLSVSHLADQVAAALEGPGRGLIHVAGWNWRIRELAHLAADVASRRLRKSVPVHTGTAHEPVVDSYEFTSSSLPAQAGSREDTMRRFLDDALAYLQETQGPAT